MTNGQDAGAGARRIEVRGTVQGVGFRPFVYRLATARGLRGDVRNAGGAVVIRAAGDNTALDDFAARLVEDAPRHASVTDVLTTRLADAALPAGFSVLGSAAGAAAARDVPPDLATCDACLEELYDPADRRYRYPFVNCTDCGPRASIIAGLPYDRARTTMRGFAMCAACAAEYHDPADRRFHAEPIACPDCGPRTAWRRGAAAVEARPDAAGEEAVAAAVAAIAGGGVVAVKGIGGYQLVCDATGTGAVQRLRAAKGREAKPLAVMVADVAAASALASLTAADVELLASPARPIVLAPQVGGAVAPQVCSGMPDIGIFLPYSPLHHLLLRDLARPVVVTSANRAGGPMVIDDDEAVRLFAPVTDGVLAHDRPVLARHDDSVVRVRAGRPSTVRRARGYAPAPLPLPVAAPEPLLALGAQLKHTFTVASGRRAVPGPHIGDLEDAETLEAFERSLEARLVIEDVDPVYVAHDLHPEYLSTKHAARWPAERRIAVQHHHAHVAATAAEHEVEGPFLGVAYDGLGLGDDGTFWGGEVLLATYAGYRRLGRFSRAPLCGGAVAVRRPARMALGYLFGAEDLGGPALDAPPAAHPAARLPEREVALVRRMIDRRLNSPPASSAGRLFDAVAALLGVCEDNRFEGEAAMRLEAAAAGHGDAAPLAWRLARRDGLWVYDGAATLRDVLEARSSGEPPGAIAAAFHHTLAAVTAALCERAGEETGVRTVCLSGGVFQNRALETAVRAALGGAGFEVFAGERVPVNDGGVSYGQAVVAAARLSAATSEE
ncbi:carbamoyltransferase HypF [Actinomadura litoris]|uniref:Carbamoyltransferase n=1 Tax=Actinomadura litoris TaxID=2678616 RepID=A0A7K1L5W7_9ACTN|nr:carbamoyltransferase HypF [Actinomadura litoris]MUN39656.1 carbamoyltransferase HypF [Actinomadura litoris]